MARIGDAAGREHSGHYLAAVASVAVVVAAMAWFSQNRTLAAAAAALGLYVLHLFSIRFLLENQKRQQRVLDAQWEVLQRFIGPAEDGPAVGSELEDLVPAMPVDRESPEQVDEPPRGRGAVPSFSDADLGGSPVVPPVESLRELEQDSDYALVIDEGDPLPEDGGADPERDSARRSQEAVKRLSHSGELRAAGAEVPVPRHFALGTVALVRNLLTPAEVARVLLEQRMQPGKKFGVLAVEMGLLSDSQREELLLAQQEGLFTDGEMREARQRLREFRENAAHSMAGLD